MLYRNFFGSVLLAIGVFTGQSPASAQSAGNVSIAPLSSSSSTAGKLVGDTALSARPTPDAIHANVANPCEQETSCSMKVSGAFVVERAETLIRAGEYERAQPWLDMLALTPDYFVEYHFLSGFSAKHQGDLPGAEKHFRAILDRDPNQTRVRLELAEVLYASGDREAAGYHLRLVEQSDDLPDDLRATVRTARSSIRDDRTWRFGFNFGIAPDTNINNATYNDTVGINLGFAEFEAPLNSDARERSGLGITADFSASYRLPLSEKTRLLVEADGTGVDYEGSIADDYNLKLAAGPEYRFSRNTSLVAQATVSQRWYGGDALARAFGGRLDLQQSIGRASNIGVRLEAEKQNYLTNDSYDNWNYGVSASYERGVFKSFRLSATGFARRNDAKVKSNSFTSYGALIGLGGELPYGYNVGMSAVYSKSAYDEPTYFFSNDKRRDNRWSARAVVGNRTVKFLGFSPSVEYSYSRNDSNYSLFESDRHRAEFKLARYF